MQGKEGTPVLCMQACRESEGRRRGRGVRGVVAVGTAPDCREYIADQMKGTHGKERSHAIRATYVFCILFCLFGGARLYLIHPVSRTE
jgi:hypothetical protein